MTAPVETTTTTTLSLEGERRKIHNAGVVVTVAANGGADDTAKETAASPGTTTATASSVVATIIVDNRSCTAKTNATDDQEEEEPGGGGGGVFAKLFGRKKRDRRQDEPRIANGAIDLLDDDDNTTSNGLLLNGDGETATSAENDDDDDEEDEDGDEELQSDDDEEEQKENASSDDQVEEGDLDDDDHDDYFDDDNNNDNCRSGGDDDDDDDDFGDFAHAPKHDEDPEEEGDEMMSLISGPVARKDSIQKNGLGASLTKFFGIKPKEEAQRERKGLLDGDTDDDDDDDDNREEEDDDNYYDNDDNGKRRRRAKNSKYSDDLEDDGESNNAGELASEAGEYRLESFYPTDSARQEFPEQSPSSSRELYGRIHGFGSESALLNYGTSSNNIMDCSSRSARLFGGETALGDREMSSMDIELASERGGLLNGVGKAVSNITQLILNRRFGGGGGDQSAEENRKRMLAYIGELEWKLVQKEKEIISWKERAEQLQLEVHTLKGKQQQNDKYDEDEEWEETEEEEEDAQEDESTGNDEKAMAAEEENDTTVREGTLIDMTPKPLVFDPLAENTKEPKEGGKVNDDLMDTSRYQSLETATSTFSEEGTQTQTKNNDTSRTAVVTNSIPFK